MCLQKGHQSIPLHHKLLSFGGWKRIRRGRRNARWVHLYAVFPETKTEMRSRGETRTAHIADDLSLLHPCASSDPLTDAAQVEVAGFVGFIVPDPHKITVPALVTRLSHGAVANGADGRAGRGSVVDSQVGPVDAQHGVKPAFGEARTNPRVVEGRFEVSPLHTLPFFIVVLRFAVG